MSERETVCLRGRMATMAMLFSGSSSVDLMKMVVISIKMVTIVFKSNVDLNTVLLTPFFPVK